MPDKQLSEDCRAGQGGNYGAGVILVSETVTFHASCTAPTGSAYIASANTSST